MKEKSKGGRPIKYTAELCAEINKKLQDYVKKTKCPIIAEFCYINDIRKQVLYDYPQFSDSIKRLIEKKECYLEKYGLKKNSSMAIFSLKQLGWTDKSEITGKDGKDLINEVKITIVK